MKIQGLLFLEEVLLTVEICWNWLKWLIFINWCTYNSNWRAQNMETGPIKIMPCWWEEPKSPLLLFCSFFVCFILFLLGVLGPLLSSQCRAGLHELSIGRCWMLWVSEKDTLVACKSLSLVGLQSGISQRGFHEEVRTTQYSLWCSKKEESGREWSQVFILHLLPWCYSWWWELWPDPLFSNPFVYWKGPRRRKGWQWLQPWKSLRKWWQWEHGCDLPLTGTIPVGPSSEETVQKWQAGKTRPSFLLRHPWGNLWDLQVRSCRIAFEENRILMWHYKLGK